MVTHIRSPISIGHCYKCRRLTILTRKRKALCPKCHANSLHIVRGKYPKYVEGHKHKFTTYTVREQRRKVIRKLKRCQLCGTTKDLTVHHIGGSTELGLTCLCRTCHSAYEAWQHRNRDLRRKDITTTLTTTIPNKEKNYERHNTKVRPRL